MKQRQLSPQANALLSRLYTGPRIAVSLPRPGSFAFSDLALSFLNSASGLCNEGLMTDFRLPVALYSLRHGVELMLKCILRNEAIDAVLRTISIPALSFSKVCDHLGFQGREGPTKRKELMFALCVIENVLERGVTFPQCQSQNIDLASAEQALAFLRANSTLPRERFAVVWASSVFGHKLDHLWKLAVPTLEVLVAQPTQRHEYLSLAMGLRELGALVELLAALDDGGDGFRYPSSRQGTWYIDVPAISLESLRNLIIQVEQTCLAFVEIRTDCYQFATLGRPTPQYC